MQKIAGTAGGRSLLKRQGSTVRSLGDATASSMNASLLRAQQGGRYPVGIKFEIYHIRDVDIVQATFFCDFTVELVFHQSYEDDDMEALRSNSCFADGTGPFDKDKNGEFPFFVAKYLDSDSMDKFYLPVVDFPNAVDVEQFGEESLFMTPNDPLGVCRIQRRYHGTFSFGVNARSFPFDAYWLEITVRMPKGKDHGRKFVHINGDLKDWIRLPEWDRYSAFCAEMDPDSRGRSRYKLILPVVRKSEFYVRNILAVTSLIGFFGGFTVFYDDDFASRMQHLLSLLFVLVGHKFIATSSVPKVPYATWVDVQTDMVMLALLLSAFGAVTLRHTPASLKLLWDYTFHVVYLVLFLGFHVWLVYSVRQDKEKLSEEMLSGSKRVLGLGSRDRVIRLRGIEEEMRWQVVLSRTRTAARKASKDMPKISEEADENANEDEAEAESESEAEPAVPSTTESAENLPQPDAPRGSETAASTPRDEEAEQPDPGMRRRRIERRDTRTMTGFG
jgi:hypothetical protein